MKLARNAFVITLTILALIATVSAQTIRTEEDPRNQAPTVGTGGPPGGPTGLFTIYDGQTLRKGEYTFSAAYSNFDRDPGNVDIVEVPLSFQVGLNDYIELFFTTDAYKALKVNSPRNLSGFYLPNSNFFINGRFQSGPAIVLAPQGSGPSQFANTAVFRPTGTAPFVGFPYNGGNAGTFGTGNPGTVFGFPGGFALLGPGVNSGGSGADNFPGIGSVYGSILPGVVLQTVALTGGGVSVEAPTVFSLAPSYLPDAPLLGRQYGESSFNTFTVGGKIRFTGPQNPIGVGIIPFYRFYADSADDARGFNQLQRGASPGSNRGDFGVVAFADARVRKWMNISANAGYIYNGDIKSGSLTLLDRPDEILAGIGVDFPVNKFFQPILEFRSTQYVGGRTPNAFENSPIEGLAGARVFPTRWFSLGGAYRYHFNQQDRDSFNDGGTFTNNATIVGNSTVRGSSNTFQGTPPGFLPSTDPHGFIGSMSIGRRNARKPESVPNQFADVNDVQLSELTVTTPCAPNQRPKEGANCSDDMAVDVMTSASDPEGDVLTYNYTVSGGRVVGQGANVSWDLSNVQPGTYTITAGVDDGCGICGKTQTKTITVAECECEVVCECPDGVTVSGPSGTTRPGDSVTFTANVSGGAGNNTYNWSVNQGTITSGQGSPSITVATTEDMNGTNVVATVQVGTEDECECNVTGEETAPIVAPDITPIAEDTFGQIPNNDVKARLDNYFVTLQNDPTSIGYIINYGTPRQVATRERLIENHIRFRRFTRSRIVFVNGGDRGNGIETQLWRVPAGANPPTPDN